MKKSLFSLLTAAFCLTFLGAQNYTVYMVGNQGYQYKMSIDDTLSPGDLPLDLSQVGSGLTWNFQGLDADEKDTLYFLAPNAQEMIDFPSANIIMESNIGRIAFDRDVNNGLYLYGTNMSFGGVNVSLNYSPAQRTLLANNVLGSMDSTMSLIDEKVYVGIDTMIATCHIQIDSIEIKRSSMYRLHFDATGELRLPTDTFPTTLRAVSSEVTLDSIFIYCPNGISPLTCFGMSAPVGWSLAPDLLISFSGLGSSAVSMDTTNAATWYTADASSPILIVDFVYDPGFTDTSFISARFASAPNADIGFEEFNPINLKIFPNPTSSILMLQSDVNLNNSTMLIYNLQGQQVKAIALNGSNIVDVSALCNGTYFYQLMNDTKLLHRGKFIIQK
jgi:hypothetical protein